MLIIDVCCKFQADFDCLNDVIEQSFIINCSAVLIILF